MSNYETYGGGPGLFPLRGDLSAEAEAVSVEVIGLQTILIAPQPFIDGASLTYVLANNDLEWLPDVDIFNDGNTYFVSLMAGDVLVYNGMDWTNAPLPTSTFFDVNGTATLSQALLNFESGSNITVSNPSAGNVSISFSGQLAQTKAAITSNWLNSYNATTGLFTATQPAYTDISGTPTLAQTFTPVFDDFLTGYNASTGLFTAAQPALAGLSDVFLTSLVAGDVLVWNGSYWVDAPLPAETWAGLTGTLSTGQVIPYADAGISRLGAASFAIGNSTNGDFTGALKLKSVLITDTAANTDLTLINTTAATAVGPTIGLVATAKANLSGASSPVNTTNATLLVCCASTTNPGVAAAVTDSQGNTWNALTRYNNGTNEYEQIFYSYSKAGGALSTSTSHTFTPTGNLATIIVYAFSGTLTTAAVYDTSSGAAGLTPGSIVPTLGDIVVTSLGYINASGNATVSAPFPTPTVETANGASNVFQSASYIIGASGGAYNPTWTAPSSTSAYNVSAMACFKVQTITYTSYSSPIMKIAGTVYDATATASITDYWTAQDIIANAQDGSSILTLSHVGSTGVSAVQVPQLDIGATDTGISRLSGASFALGNGAAGDFTGSLKLTGLNVQGSITGPYSVALTAQPATIGATNLVATPVTTALYEITYYLNDTTAGVSGTVSVTIAWNDGAAQTFTSSNVTFGTLGAYVSGVIVVKATSGAITYATTVTSPVGSPVYSLDIRVKQLT